jgi:predicted MPP superfamily phosphohydrolase
MDRMLFLATVLLAAVGHLAIWIALYNRFNATGWDRRTIKRIEKAVVAACFLIPLVIVLHETNRLGPAVMAEKLLTSDRSNWHWTTLAYGTLCALATLVLLPFWIWDRPQIAIDWRAFRMLQAHDSHLLQHTPLDRQQLFPSREFRWMSHLPGNQIGSIQCNAKELLVPSLPEGLEGLTIAHLSDVHLTGHLGIEYYRWAIEWIRSQRPEMIVLSGDIVDYEHALPLLEPVFDGLSAPLGMYFVLGNHDRRLLHPVQICDRLSTMGWQDVGRQESQAMRNQAAIRIIGNERPWFARHDNGAKPTGRSNDTPPPSVWTLGVSHSPDQWPWALANRCGLVLCGHTHGGQIRLPIVGPIIAPSWYGSRYASGIFRQQETLMHVSRGLSGVHPFRWGCMPEVSLLHLRPCVHRNR